MTSKELRQLFIDNLGTFLVDQYTAVIKGEAEFTSKDPAARKDAWELLKALITSAGEINKINAENSAGIVDALLAGKVTVDEAFRLMSMLKVQSEAEMLPAIADKLEKMGK